MAALVGVAAVAALAGCGDDAPTFADGNGGLVTLLAGGTAPPATTAEAAAGTSAPTTARVTTTTADMEPVDGCVRYYEFKIETEDADALELWDEVGEDAGGLRAECERLADDEPALVATLVEEMRAIDAFLAAAAAGSTPETTD